MKEILEKYSTRLVNVNGRNRSLVMKKIYKRRAFDITSLDEFTENIDEEVIKFILSRNKKELYISPDPYEWYTSKLEKLEKEYNENEKRMLINLKKTEKCIDEKAIKEKLDKKYEEDNEKLRRKKEKLIGYSDNIKTLTKEIKSIEKETGRYELYIGYPFVEGYFKDKTFIKSPLFLFPVEINKKGDRWVLKNKVDDSILLNKVFLIGYAKFNEEKIIDINTEYNDLSVFGENFIEGAIKELKKYNIKIIFNEKKVRKFMEITRDTMPNYNLGELIIKNNIILGQFNIASSIYNDYKEMESKDLSNSLMNKLLKNIDIGNEALSDGYRDSGEKHNDIKEKEFFFISDLDYSQELAVKKAQENSQLVIYGPPGTGKSQTIVNIVSQYLSNGKKVLMVSQKKAALDVIFNRSASINSKMIRFSNEVNKKDFYKQVADRIDSLQKNDLNIKEIENISIDIDEKLNKLNILTNVLTKETKFGLTLQEMYSKSKVNIESDSRLNIFFREFRKNYPFEWLKYSELESISNSLLSMKTAEKYYKLKEIMSSNKYVDYLKDNIDLYDLEDSKNNINKLIASYEDIISKLNKNNKYNEISKKIVLENKNLIESVKEINKKENGYLLDKLTIGSKLSIKYWLNLKKNKAKEEENLKLFNEKEKELTTLISNEISSIKSVIYKLEFLNDILVTKEVKKIINNFDNKQEVISSLKLISKVLNRYDEIMSLKGVVNDIEEDQLKVLEYIYYKEKDFKYAYNIIKNIATLSIQVHIGRIQCQYRKELEGVENFETIRKEISEEMINKRKKVPEYINRMWDNNAIYNKSANEKLWKEMYRQCTKRSQLLPIREFVNKFDSSIFELYPCWLLSPESVSEVLPLTEGLFDVIIFDEASQMFIESAIPVIYRGKKVIVAGDDKQLRPSSTFLGRYEDEDEDEENMESAAALEEESLLDLAKYSFDSTSLYYHYRSKYDELINFSNYAFYGGKLEVSPNISKTSGDGVKPIERIKVNGRWNDRRNEREAIEVVKLIKDILFNRKENETIGIITFNINQRECIDKMLELEVGKDPAFGVLYTAESERVENNEDVSLFIKNIENVQGDERDIIIFSTAYAKNEHGKVVMNFGSLSQDGGENRLNVAISRAKKKIYLVTSIEPEELKVDSLKNNGPKLFKRYLQYVKAVSDGNRELTQEILNSVCDSKVGRNEEIHFDSDFENEVHDALEEAGLVVDTQIGVSGYKIDLGVYDTKRSKYILGIECDGAAFHSSKSARERDIYRQRYLESRGWNIIRIWSKNWWSNPQREVDRIVKRVNEILAEN
ncbi:AAA domain-containing protein [Clostridium saudiense]|uniref:AAA domain-containing protein n=1 Tax=Clostridium saudiense TaxID=1414720 RepID=UPI0004AE398B|nr:AAA domain-containing protein [Clostridium saudiense]